MSDELPGELDDQARFNAWRDIYLGTIFHFDVERLTDRPFSMRYEFMPVGEVALARLKVSDIVLSCGFNEVSYFNRCFRRHFGLSPTQYRGRDDGMPGGKPKRAPAR